MRSPGQNRCKKRDHHCPDATDPPKARSRPTAPRPENRYQAAVVPNTLMVIDKNNDDERQ